MKKIKFLLIAMMAMMSTTAFVACGDDDEETKDGPVKTSTTTVEDLVGTWNIGN